MTQMIAITILVPDSNIEIDAKVANYSELRHEPASTDVEVNSVSIMGLDYEIDSWDVIDIDNLAAERFNEGV